MVRRIETVRCDDLTGEPGAVELLFGLNGTSYTIDLDPATAADVESWFHDLIPKARVLRAAPKKRPITDGTPTDPASVRQWAKSQGIPVSARGRLPAPLIAAYHTRADRAGSA